MGWQPVFRDSLMNAPPSHSIDAYVDRGVACRKIRGAHSATHDVCIGSRGSHAPVVALALPANNGRPGMANNGRSPVVLVTGGCGYIGSQLIRDLAQDPRLPGLTIRILD